MTDREFVDMVARLQMEGDEDENGSEVEWSNDDAFATLMNLISHARSIVEKREEGK